MFLHWQEKAPRMYLVLFLYALKSLMVKVKLYGYQPTKLRLPRHNQLHHGNVRAGPNQFLSPWG